MKINCYLRNNKQGDLGQGHLSAMFLTLMLLAMLGVLVQAQAQSKSAGSATLQVLSPMPDKPQAPDFTLKDTNGKEHSLVDYRGKVVIVNFWAVWCLPCRKEMPSMQRAWEKVRDQDVVILAVNWGDNLESIGKFTASLPPMDFPLLVGGDEAMTQAWSVRGLPTTYVINPEGAMAYKLVGEAEWDKPELLEQVLELKKG